MPPATTHLTSPGAEGSSTRGAAASRGLAPRRGRALIIAAGFRLQYRVLRCAAESFGDVFVLGTPDAAHLRRSARCRGFFSADAGFGEADGRLVAQINEICREHQIDVVLPSCAATTRFLATFGRELTVPHYPVPTQDAFDALDDKWNFARLCSRLGVPVPATRLFATRAEFIAEAQNGRVTFPCVLKPLSMWGSFGVAKLDHPGDIEADGFEPILVQDYVPGHDLCAFYLCRDGRISASLAYERTQEGVRFISTPEIDAAAALIVSQLECSGTIGFDVRRTPDGRHLFIECNPRFWYRMEVAAIAGLNFVTLGVRARDTALGRIPSGTTIRSPRRLIAALLTPWRLSRHDLALLRYLASDPLPVLIAAAQKLLGKDRLASGHQLLWPLLVLLGA